MRSVLAMVVTAVVLATAGCNEPPPEMPDLMPVPDLWSPEWQPCSRASDCKPNFTCMGIYGDAYAYCTNFCGSSTAPPEFECHIGSICTKVANPLVPVTDAGTPYVEICTKVESR